MFELGAGPTPIPKKQLTAERLAAAITQALTPAIGTQATRLGIRLHQENGVGTAVRVVNRLLKSGSFEIFAVSSQCPPCLSYSHPLPCVRSRSAPLWCWPTRRRGWR